MKVKPNSLIFTLNSHKIPDSWTICYFNIPLTYVVGKIGMEVNKQMYGCGASAWYQQHGMR